MQHLIPVCVGDTVDFSCLQESILHHGLLNASCSIQLLDSSRLHNRGSQETSCNWWEQQD